MFKCSQKSKLNPQYSKEMLYRRLEIILKQMLIVWAKQSVAIRNISGMKSGNHSKKKLASNKIKMHSRNHDRFIIMILNINPNSCYACL